MGNATVLYWIGGSSVKGILIATNILIIILGAIALYYSMRASGALRRISNTIINLNPDRRVQTSLAWILLRQKGTDEVSLGITKVVAQVSSMISKLNLPKTMGLN